MILGSATPIPTSSLVQHPVLHFTPEPTFGLIEAFFSLTVTTLSTSLVDRLRTAGPITGGVKSPLGLVVGQLNWVDWLLLHSVGLALDPGEDRIDIRLRDGPVGVDEGS